MLLPDVMLRSLEDQESDPTSIPTARQTLEDVLSFQFKAIANALLAERMLRDGAIALDVAIQHFDESSGQAAVNVDRIRAEQRQFVKGIARGVQEPLPVRDLSQVQIRILGGMACLWDDYQINQQLRDLGSNVRLVFPGASRLGGLALKEMLGGSDEDWPVDARFILGRVGAKTAGPFGPVFDFDIELAVSPFVDPSATGFAYENKAVLRRPVIRRVIEGRQTHTTEPQTSFRLQCIHNLIHELIHAAAYNHPSQQSYAGWHYFQDIAADICRFTMIARERADIEEAFDFSFEHDIVMKKVEAVGHTIPEEGLPSAMQVVEALVNDGRIRFDSGSYLSIAYADGRRWAF